MRMKNTQRTFLVEPPERPLPSALLFLRHARFRLLEDCFVKINLALAELDDEHIWWRPNQSSNSIGNLILHLSGNVRQWIVAGAGGAADVRNRAQEFAERNRIGKGELLDLLKTTLDEADAVLAGVENECLAARNDEPLQRVCKPQAFEQTVLDAVFHVVEHFSYHTGQIVFAAKWLAEGRVRFYDDRRLNQEK